MSLNAVLVDRARLMIYAPTGRKANGATVFEWTTGPWFRCRLQQEASRESTDAAGGRIEEVSTPTMLVGVRTLDGQPLSINGEDRIEVASVELGGGIYDVQGDPAPIRKKRSVLGFTVSLQRVVPSERAPVVP